MAVVNERGLAVAKEVISLLDNDLIRVQAGTYLEWEAPAGSVEVIIPEAGPALADLITPDCEACALGAAVVAACVLDLAVMTWLRRGEPVRSCYAPTSMALR